MESILKLLAILMIVAMQIGPSSLGREGGKFFTRFL